MTRQINLFNPALRARREWLTGKFLLNGLGVMVVLLGLYGGVVRWQNRQLADAAGRIGAELAEKQQELARLGEEIAQRKVSVETQDALQRAESALQGRERVREALESGALGSAEGFAAFLRAFARQTRDGLWMVGLEMTEGGRSITLAGRALNPDQIPGYIRGLSGEPTLSGRSFEALNVQLVSEEGNKDKPADSAAAAATVARGEAVKIPEFHEFLLSATTVQANAGPAAGGQGGQR